MVTIGLTGNLADVTILVTTPPPGFGSTRPESKARYDTRIITERRLREFWETYPDAEKPLKAWRQLMRSKSYAPSHEVRADFPSVDFLKDKVTVFDIGGNKYRLVVTMRYDWEKVFIRHVVTHKEYDRLSKDGAL
jgi:mRNA interferase HigB